MSAVMHNPFSESLQFLSCRILLGTIASYSEPSSSYSWTAPTDPYPYGDPVPRIFTNSKWDLGFRDSRFALGLSHVDRTHLYDSEVVGMKPINLRYHEPRDFRRYHSLFSDLLMMRSNAELSRDRFSRDKEVRHANVKGDFYPDVDADWNQQWFPFPFLHFGILWPGVSGSPLGPAGHSVNMHLGNQINAYPLNPGNTGFWQATGGPRSNLDEIIDFVDEIYWVGSESGLSNLRTTRIITVLDTESQGDSISIDYLYKLDQVGTTTSWGWIIWQCRLEFRLKMTEPSIYSPITEFPAYRYISNWYVDATYSHSVLDGAFYNGNSHHGGSYVVQPWASATDQYPVQTLTDCSSGIEIDLPKLKQDVYSVCVNAEQYYQHEMQNIRPAAFYSSADALEGYVSTLKNNYLEELHDLPELASLIPDMGLLLKALWNLKKDPVAGAYQLGEFLSDLCLTINFGWLPTASDVKELNRFGPKIMASFDRFLDPHPVQLSGKFRFDFPIHPYWGQRTLTCRSTIYLESIPTDFINGILGLDSIGLLPSFHRTWEVIPMSFAVDWVTGMGRRIHDVDTSLLFSLMRVHWAEHTFTVSHPISSSMPISGIDVERTDAEIVWFQRDLSRRVPALTASKYDFRASPYAPSFGVLGSLLFQKGKA